VASSTVIFGTLLVVLSLVLLAIHWTAWRKSDHGGLGEREQQFALRQFRRRTQASGMLGAIGLLMLTTQWVEEDSMKAALWLATLCAVLWVAAMALIDWWATRTYYGRDEVVNTVQIEYATSSGCYWWLGLLWGWWLDARQSSNY
jgi:hypothetical protein